MSDIQVNLRAKFDKASGGQAAREMADTVKSAASGNTQGGIHPSGKMPAHIWFEQQKAKALAAGGGGGLSAGGAAALGGAAGGAAALAVAAIKLIFRAIASSIQVVTNALNRAAQFYARQLQAGGLAGGMMAQRSGLANVIGVSEKEVWQYGAAVNHLNDRLKFSARINSETNRNVTAAAWASRVVGEDFKALAMVMANELAPSIRIAMNSIHSIMRSFGSDFVKYLTQFLVQATKTTYAMAFGPGTVWLAKMLSSSKDTGVAPAPAASAHRYQSSHLERMGLVIGQGVNSNPLRATERNTRSAAATLKEIKAFLAPRTSNGYPVGPIPNAA